MAKYDANELRLIGKVPPDAWTVVTTFEGVSENGEYISLDEALVELGSLLRGDFDVQFDSIEIAPLWNSAAHENEK